MTADKHQPQPVIGDIPLAVSPTSHPTPGWLSPNTVIEHHHRCG
jgi:hypothetical protein